MLKDIVDGCHGQQPCIGAATSAYSRGERRTHIGGSWSNRLAMPVGHLLSWPLFNLDVGPIWQAGIQGGGWCRHKERDPACRYATQIFSGHQDPHDDGHHNVDCHMVLRRDSKFMVPTSRDARGSSCQNVGPTCMQVLGTLETCSYRGASAPGRQSVQGCAQRTLKPSSAETAFE